VECALAQALQDAQVAAAVDADAGRPRVGELLPGGCPNGHGMAAGVGHLVILLCEVAVCGLLRLAIM
jgi:hypothetical protein